MEPSKDAGCTFSPELQAPELMFFRLSALTGEWSVTERSLLVALSFSVTGISVALDMCFSSLGVCWLVSEFWWGFFPLAIGTSSERLAISGLCSVKVPDGNFFDHWATLSGSKLSSSYSTFDFAAKLKTVIWSFNEDTSDMVISSFLWHSDINRRTSSSFCLIVSSLLWHSAISSLIFSSFFCLISASLRISLPLWCPSRILTSSDSLRISDIRNRDVGLPSMSTLFFRSEPSVCRLAPVCRSANESSSFLATDFSLVCVDGGTFCFTVVLLSTGVLAFRCCVIESFELAIFQVKFKFNVHRTNFLLWPNRAVYTTSVNTVHITDFWIVSQRCDQVVTNLGPVHKRGSLSTLLEAGGSTRYRNLVCDRTLR